MDRAAWPTLLVGVVFVFLWAIWRFFSTPTQRPSLRSVAILVLGDIGRSPRMMYHAETFATMGFETYLIGYSGSKPVPSLLSLPHVHFLYLESPSAFLASLPFVISAPRKVIHQVIDILHILLVRIPYPPEFIMVQNPPSIPTLALVWLVARFRGSKVIIDWHNLGYSILALKLGEHHVFVKMAKLFEAYFGRCAYAHLFVTQAMHDFLVREWDLKGHKAILHDRPPAHFHPASPGETHELFLRLQPSLPNDPFLPNASPPRSTAFTASPRDENASQDTDPLVTGSEPLPALRPDRPALLVSSTSWTPDEDFGLLLTALALYEQRARDRPGLPKVFMVVTGKGPQRAEYMRQIERVQRGEDGAEPWRFVRCVSLWLEAEDYPILLGSADLGISLHSSSSALDLPMKVVDMFGCGLPVCALGFACLDELVKDGVNGLVFTDAPQLAAQLETLLTGHPASPSLATLRASLQTSTPRSPNSHASPYKTDGDWEWSTWAQNWERIVRPLVLSDVDGWPEEQ
ncbi:mannosyltransferase [Amylocystis lapponica]|nr:mannosyltransferase [Amylocystis lapponica]